MCDLDTRKCLGDFFFVCFFIIFFKAVHIVSKSDYPIAEVHLAELTMPGNLK